MRQHLKAKTFTNKTKSHIWPESETPCIWMQAGLVEYKLCDQHLDCENCPFDALWTGRAPHILAKERHLKKITVIRKNQPTPSIEDRDIWHSYRQIFFDPEAYYGLGFWYIKPLAAELVRVGLDDIAALFLPAIREIILPKVGTKIEGDRTCVYLVTMSGTITLPIPLTGRVVNVNQQLVQAFNHPDGRQRGDLWLFELQTQNVHQIAATMHRGNQTALYLMNRWQTIVAALEKALYCHHSQLGQTQQDGGQPMRTIEQMLGQNEYFAIIVTFFK